MQSTKSNKDPSKIRCKHWPKCNKKPEECEYHHPTEPCKHYPKCTFGEDKCLFVHPDEPCKFADKCTRMNCAYKHTEEHKQQRKMMMDPIAMMMAAMGQGG